VGLGVLKEEDVVVNSVRGKVSAEVADMRGDAPGVMEVGLLPVFPYRSGIACRLTSS
jgi:hypothetical protein